MCVIDHYKDRRFWKELDDNLIYFQNDTTYYYDCSHLRLKNIKADKTMEYLNIVPKTLGVLNKQNSYLSLFIETYSQTIMAKLDRNSLKLRINHRICQQYLFYIGPIYDFNNNILSILQNRRLVQMFKSKLIRKYKGRIEQIQKQHISIRMGLRSFNLLRRENYLFFSQFQSIFEKQFNISLQNIDETYGFHIFKKLGNFLILKKHYKYQHTQGQLPIYYLSIDNIISGDGMKGKIQLGNEENLKMIKCFNNTLYVVVQENGYFKVYEIKDQFQRESVFVVSDELDLKKPILQQQNIIFTNKNQSFIPQVYEIEYKINKIEIK